MRIVVIGLGYVGLPLAVELAKHFECWGLDIDESRIAELRAGSDRTREVEPETLGESALHFASRADECPSADAYIVTVPSPVDIARQPDLGPILAATRTVADMIDPALRPVVIYESTVYPGVTEEICGPLIEQAGGHERGRDFVLAYSPERINPGDHEHSVDRIVKVIAGEDPETTERLAEIYGKVTSAGVFRAASIKAAEAAKVIENAQRDINIAFINEITQIFSRIDLSIWDVLAAAQTKWNFLPFTPGLVGGHCIGVDPYYLSHRALELGHHPQVILAGRAINDGMGEWIAERIHERRGARPGTVLILGLTFKEDVPDTRNSKVIDLIRRLQARGHDVCLHDPLVDSAEFEREYGMAIRQDALSSAYNTVVCAVRHSAYRAMANAEIAKLVEPGGLIADIKGVWRDRNLPDIGERWSL